MVNNFKRQLEGNGRIGERLFKQYASDSSRVKTVTELVDLKEQRKGTDFLVALHSGISYTVEVKYDVRSSITGNFFIETRQHGKQGWLYTTQADWMFIINGNIKRALFVRPNTLKSHILSSKGLRTVGCNADYDNSSSGVLLPTDKVPGHWVTIK